jgi:hypothetical protein
MKIEHLFLSRGALSKEYVGYMDLAQAGIAIRCHCGANMATDMANVLFDDKGRVKIGRQPIRCPACGAIYRYGEHLKYGLVRPQNGAAAGTETRP